jgi:hypothetical protein
MVRVPLLTMKRLALFVAVLTVAAACSSTDDAAPTTEIAPAADAATTATTAAPAEDSNATRDSMGDSGASLVPNQTIAPEGPEAPDFTMALADGDTFTLSEQSLPVYMIFWADW